jgi:hypothetical protein
MTCVNCGADADGRYCSNCGQRLTVKRITFKEGWHDFWARIYGFDGMFPRTLKDLTLRPGFAAREFIRGNRVRYYGPVGYYFFIITLFLLLLSIFDMNYVDYLKAMQESLPIQQQETKLSNEMRSWVAENMKIVAFAIVPFIAFTSRFVFFRKQRLNFLEHSVPVFYMLGHWYWINMVEALVFYYTGFTMGTGLQYILIAVYMGIGYISFVPDQPKWKVFLKGVGTYFMGFVCMFIVAVILGITIGFVLAMVDPSALDGIRPSKNP